MATLLPHRPSLVLAPFPDRTATNPLLRTPPTTTTHPYGLLHHRPFLRGSLAVAHLGFKPGMCPDPDAAQGLVQELFGRAESFLYTVADAAVSSSSSLPDADSVTTTKQSGDWLSGITNSLETVLKVF